MGGSLWGSHCRLAVVVRWIDVGRSLWVDHLLWISWCGSVTMGQSLRVYYYQLVVVGSMIIMGWLL